MFLALLLGSFVVGILLGSLTRVRFGLLLVPPVAVALVYWIGVGWRGNAHDMGRDGLLLVTGMIGALFVASWAAGAGLGRSVRVEPVRVGLSREALGSQSAPGTDPPAASRR